MHRIWVYFLKRSYWPLHDLFRLFVITISWSVGTGWNIFQFVFLYGKCLRKNRVVWKLKFSCQNSLLGLLNTIFLQRQLILPLLFFLISRNRVFYAPSICSIAVEIISPFSMFIMILNLPFRVVYISDAGSMWGTVSNQWIALE